MSFDWMSFSKKRSLDHNRSLIVARWSSEIWEVFSSNLHSFQPHSSDMTTLALFRNTTSIPIHLHKQALISPSSTLIQDSNATSNPSQSSTPISYSTRSFTSTSSFIPRKSSRAASQSGKRLGNERRGKRSFHSTGSHNQDFYKILGVNKKADQREIKAQFYKVSRVFLQRREKGNQGDR